jgi:hypothetical protein
LFEQLSLLSQAARARATGFEQRKLLRKRLRKENEERTIAAEILSRRLRGDSFGSIARLLNRQGWKGRNGSRWYAASVRNYFVRARGHADA